MKLRNLRKNERIRKNEFSRMYKIYLSNNNLWKNDWTDARCKNGRKEKS